MGVQTRRFNRLRMISQLKALSIKVAVPSILVTMHAYGLVLKCASSSAGKFARLWKSVSSGVFKKQIKHFIYCNIPKATSLTDLLQHSKGLLQHSKSLCMLLQHSKCLCMLLQHSKGLCMLLQHSKGLCMLLQHSKGLCMLLQHSKCLCMLLQHSKGLCMKSFTSNVNFVIPIKHSTHINPTPR